MSELSSYSNKILSTGITEANFMKHHVRLAIIPEGVERLIDYQATSRGPNVVKAVSNYFQSNCITVTLSNEETLIMGEEPQRRASAFFRRPSKSNPIAEVCLSRNALHYLYFASRGASMTTNALTSLPHEIEHFLNFLIYTPNRHTSIEAVLKTLGIGSLGGYIGARLADLREVDDSILGIRASRRSFLGGTAAMAVGIPAAFVVESRALETSHNAAVNAASRAAVRHEDTPEIYAGLADRLKTDRTLYDLTVNSFSFQKL